MVCVCVLASRVTKMVWSAHGLPVARIVVDVEAFKVKEEKKISRQTKFLKAPNDYSNHLLLLLMNTHTPSSTDNTILEKKIEVFSIQNIFVRSLLLC